MTQKTMEQLYQDAAGQTYYKRKPFIISTDFSAVQAERAESSDPTEKELYKKYRDIYGVSGIDDYIVAAINPSDMNITATVRSATERAKNAVAYHAWPGTASDRFNTLDVSFVFQTGFLLPHWKAEAVTKGDWRSYLSDWYDALRLRYSEKQESGKFVEPLGVDMRNKFMALVNQPTVLENGALNYVTIETNSITLPSLSLRGFFSKDGIGPAEMGADDPYQYSWTAVFIATSTSPTLGNEPEMRQRFRSAFYEQLQFGKAMGELLPNFLSNSSEQQWWEQLLTSMLSGENIAAPGYSASWKGFGINFG